MSRKKKNNATSPVVSFLIIILAVIYYSFGGGVEDTKVVQNNYSTNLEVEESINTNVSSDLEIYFFDVGQADSMLVVNNGKYMLIDAGNNEDGASIANQLKEMGITKIDYLVGTHPHEDHIGGLDDVIENLDIDTIYMPKREADTKTFKDVLTAISSKNLKVTTPNVGDTFYLGEAMCEIVSVESNADETNDSSIVIQMTFGEKEYLFTGDIEKTLERELTWDDIDVLKVAHHGSGGSSTEEFLAATTPEIAIISAGEGNSYGHPHEDTIERLEDVGVEIYRTDESGTIYLKSDGTQIYIESLNICLDGNEE